MNEKVCIANTVNESKLMVTAQNIFSCLDSIYSKINNIEGKLFTPQLTTLTGEQSPVLDNLEDTINAINRITNEIYNKIDKIQYTI
jgi:hypothetical protein